MSNWKDIFISVKKKTIQAILGAMVVLITVSIIIVLSKSNDTRHHRVPFSLKKRVKDMVEESANKIKEAQNNESKDKGLSYHNTVEAHAFLKAAKTLIGLDTLPKLSGYDINALENKIESLYHKFVTDPASKRNEQKKMNSEEYNKNLKNITDNQGVTDLKSIKNPHNFPTQF